MQSTPNPQLLLATIKLLRERMVFHRSWSGDIVAKAVLDSAEDVEEVPLEDSTVSAAEVSILSRRRSKGAKKRKKKQVRAIVFGQTPLKLLADTPYTFFVEPSTLKDLLCFYKEAFRDGEYAYNLSSAYGAKKGSEDDKDFFKSGKKNLRKDPAALLKKRFTDCAGAGAYDEGETTIFRLVRFCHLERDTLPRSYASFMARFPQRAIGLKQQHYKVWAKKVEGLFKSSGLSGLLVNLRRLSDEKTRMKREIKKITDEADKSAPHDDTDEGDLSTRLDTIEKKKAEGVYGGKQRTDLDYLDYDRSFGRLRDKQAVHSRLTKEFEEMNGRLKGAIVPFYRKPALRVLPSDKGAFQNRLDRRAMKDHLEFFATCPDYWKVARDFPSVVMDYVLKPCQKRQGCSTCKEMAEFHLRNIHNGSMELILAPQSPFLRKSGQTIFGKNLARCLLKWKDFARFDSFSSKSTPLVLERMELYRSLVDGKSRRASTTYEIPLDLRDKFRAIDGPTGAYSLFGDLLDSFFEDQAKERLLLQCKMGAPTEAEERALFTLPSLLGFMQSLLKHELLLQLNSIKFMLSSDFLHELELSIQLRDIPVYEGGIPFGCSSIRNPPNKALRLSLPSVYGTDDCPYDPDGPVCIAFARRWRVKDLVKEIRSCKKRVLLHVDAVAPFVFHPRDDLQDWYSELPWQSDDKKAYFCCKEHDDSCLLQFEGTDKVLVHSVKGTDDLKALMERCADGECYLLCLLDKKRKHLLETSVAFRNDPLRRVLKRTFPQAGTSVYGLTVEKAKDLKPQEMLGELTVATPASVNVFGPRKEVYLVGDMWTETSLEVAKHLATEKLYTVKLEASMPQRYKFWQYNDARVAYKNNGFSLPYSTGAFSDISRFLEKHQSGVNLFQQKAEQGHTTQHKRQKAKELQAQRDAKRRRIEGRQ